MIKKSRKNYVFNPDWELEYFMCAHEGKSMCLICQTVLAIPKKGNIVRHFTTHHPGFDNDFKDLKSTQRKAVLQKLKRSVNQQKSSLKMFVSKPSAATAASFAVSHILIKSKKPFSDGEIIKDAFLAAAEFLFAEFTNKDKIISAIADLQLSRRSVSRRVEDLAADVSSQLKEDIQTYEYFSLQFDESCDATDTAQLTVFARMVFKDFSTKEELLKLIPLHGRTRGEDVFKAFMEFVEKESLPLKKLVSITTDGAPSMTGKTKGFVSLCHANEAFPIFFHYHCIIHQQALCAKLLNFDSVMKKVIKIINSIRAHPLHRRLFKDMQEQLKQRNTDLLLHTEVRWLSKGAALDRFWELLPQIREFLKTSGESVQCLSDGSWLASLAFLTDLTQKLNEVNTQLQGREKDVVGMIQEVESFQARLKHWSSQLGKGVLKHFSRLKQHVEDFPGVEVNFVHFREVIDAIESEFSSRFSDFKIISPIAKFLLAPFAEVDIERLANIISSNFCMKDTDVENEIINLQASLVLQAHKNDPDMWKLVESPCPRKVALKMKALFGSTYLCESSFSDMNLIKSKLRTQLTDTHLEDCMRVAVSNYTPRFSILTDGQCQASH